MEERTITNYIVRKYSGEDIWNYMFNNVNLKNIKVENDDMDLEDPVSFEVIDELLDDDEKHVELIDIGKGYFFTNKGRMLKPHERYWAHPAFASKSSKGIVPNGYAVPPSTNFTISKGLKQHFNITDKNEILEIRMGLIDIYQNKEKLDIVRREEK